jgi:hypothetical protein
MANPGQLIFLDPTNPGINQDGNNSHNDDANENHITSEIFTGVQNHPANPRNSPLVEAAQRQSDRPASGCQLR